MEREAPGFRGLLLLYGLEYSGVGCEERKDINVILVTDSECYSTNPIGKMCPP